MQPTESEEIPSWYKAEENKGKQQNKSNIFMTTGQVGRGNVAMSIFRGSRPSRRKLWAVGSDLKALNKTSLKFQPNYSDSAIFKQQEDQDLIFNLMSIEQGYTYKAALLCLPGAIKFSKTFKINMIFFFKKLYIYIFFCQVVETFSGHLPNTAKHNWQVSFI